MKRVEKKNLPFILGLTAFILVFSINWSVNLIGTSFIRGLIASFIFIVLGYIMHYFLFTLKMESKRKQDMDYSVDRDLEDISLDEIYQTSKENNSESEDFEFERLQFDKLDTKNYK